LQSTEDVRDVLPKIPESLRNYVKSSRELDAIIARLPSRMTHGIGPTDLNKLMACLTGLLELNSKDSTLRTILGRVRWRGNDSIELLSKDQKEQLVLIREKGAAAQMEKVFDFAEEWDSPQIEAFLEILNEDKIAGGALREVLSPAGLALLGASNTTAGSSRNVSPSWIDKTFVDRRELKNAMMINMGDILVMMLNKGLITQNRMAEINEITGDNRLAKADLALSEMEEKERNIKSTPQEKAQEKEAFLTVLRGALGPNRVKNLLRSEIRNDNYW
jgi:hypothetical protein